MSTSRIRAWCAAAAVTATAKAVVAAPPAGAEPLDELRRLLPAGYGPDSCEPAQPGFLGEGALAGLNCRDNSLPGGPAYAQYELFADRNMLGGQFQHDVNARHPQPVPCPGGRPSPGSWHDDRTPNQSFGSVLCGRLEGGPDLAVEWTNESNLVLALASGPDLANLYDWWTASR
ncbi:hypothetical protein [Mycobacterium sp. Z3061]|uniref:hypothetical protein n=1 Tax=Mycobacterium sp. Z3061 TaxID=3073562 RepID=UPI002872FE59|nr:hypothetical protein [Mycobacterium sp. Z3061]